jgi:hypothetical protein
MYALLVVLGDYAAVVVVDVGRIGILGHGEIGSSWFFVGRYAMGHFLLS